MICISLQEAKFRKEILRRPLKGHQWEPFIGVLKKSCSKKIAKFMENTCIRVVLLTRQNCITGAFNFEKVCKIVFLESASITALILVKRYLTLYKSNKGQLPLRTRIKLNVGSKSYLRLNVLFRFN